MTESAQPSDPNTDLPERPVSVNEATPMPPPSFTVSVPTMQKTPTGEQATVQSGRAGAESAAAGVRQFGSYLLLQQIAHGGMGTVYRARHIELGREVALKTIKSGMELKPSLIERFYQEAKAVALLKHPHVIQLFDYGIVDGQHFFTMFFAEGGSLYKHLERFQANPRLAVALLEKVARAVQHIHEHGLLHRDLKPANILLDRNDEPLVSDFGLAKSLEAELDLTRSGSALGTPAYMAPEQAAGHGELVSSKTDVWALGVILYELLCGQKPFVGQSREEVIRAIQESEPSMPRALQPRLDRSLEAILQKCLEREPSRRYPSAGALADDLGAWLRGEPVRARQAKLTEKVFRSIRRRPKTASFAALVCLTSVAAMLIAYSRDPQRVVERWQRQLTQGEEAVIVGPKGYPEYRKWRIGKAVHEGLDDEGVYKVASAELGLLELMPDPGIKRYRIRADLKHVGGEPIGEVGFYTNHRELAEPGGAVHCFCQLTFNDFSDLSKIARLTIPGKVADGNLIQFQPHLHRDPDIDHRVGGLSKVRFVPAFAWRSIQITVTDAGIHATWDGVDLGQLSKAVIKNDIIRTVKRSNNVILDPDELEFPARSGFGLYIDRASATLANVVIVPLQQDP